MSNRGLRQLLKQFVSLRTGRGLNIISSEDDPRLVLSKMRQDAALGILLTHDRKQPTHEIIFSVRATPAADRSPLAYPIFVPNSLRSQRAELFI